MRASPSTLRSWALAVGRSAEAAGTPWTPPTSTAVRLGAAGRGGRSVKGVGGSTGGHSSSSGSNNCASLHTASNGFSSASLASTTARPSLPRTAPITATLAQVSTPPRRLLSTHTPTLLSAPSNPEEPNVYSRPDAEGEAVVDDPSSASASSSSYSPSVLLTDRAIKHLQKVAKREGAEKAKRMALRIAVEPGGCHGYQYKMELVDAEEGRDEVGEEDDL